MRKQGKPAASAGRVWRVSDSPMKIPLIATTAALTCFTCLPLARAADKPETEAMGGSLDKKDMKFVTMAAQGGMTEVMAGKTAEKKGMSATVKEFGAMMVKDHEKANAELKKIAMSKGVTPPPALDAKHTEELEAVSKKEGAAFDAAYLASQEKDHKATIELFEMEAKEGQDPELKAFATKTLPTLKMHAEHVTKAMAMEKEKKA